VAIQKMSDKHYFRLMLPECGSKVKQKAPTGAVCITFELH